MGGRRFNTDTLLISMPFQKATSPSLAIGLLAAIGRREGFEVDTAHFTLDFAAKIGPTLYDAIAGTSGHDLGNWFFSAAAFGENAPDSGDRFPNEMPNTLTDVTALGFDGADLVRLRRETVPAFLHELDDAVDWQRYGVVGFTTTFEQNGASLALARRLRARFPELVIIMGGANCSGEMGRELVQRCDWIDYVVDGEGDDAFPRLLRALADGYDPTTAPGVLSRTRQGSDAARLERELDSLPTPEFDEYYVRADRLGLFDKSQIKTLRLPFEASRGCWWGQKHHCTFCGLNGQSMAFRQKSSARVLSELSELARRHGVFRFDAVDNIMPRDFLREFLPALKREGRSYDLFFEIKSNLTKEDVGLLRDAGVRHIQPGIESLNSHVLRLMRKGVTAAQNVNLLRWARFHEVDVSWNVLLGFPEERPEHYEDQPRLFRNLRHLYPPMAASRVELQRFSPFHSDRERFPVRWIAPSCGLSYVYPAEFDLERIAYHFEHEFESELPPETFEPIRLAVSDWQAAWGAPEPPSLTYQWSPGLVHIDDSRDPGASLLYAFEGEVAEIYRSASDRPVSPSMIAANLKQDIDAAEVADVLDLFVAKGLAMEDEGRYLALAVPEAGR